MDISNLKSSTRTIEILHPATKENIGIRVELVSFDDDRVAQQRRRYNNYRLQQEQRGKIVKAEELETYNNEMLAAAIVSWEWYDANFHGEVPALNHINAMKVFKELSWFRDQISEVVLDAESFFQS
jgi:hypothetical protein